ncbi:uncharacterized protein A1O9_01460 [Exophiala aquamarina CBS 119918]|uniref:Sur7 protein n=1 Tax=Exophiala aquamarina CBS 119918 TaxID=1182545 RepID=A0A072PUP6_9EURO|nr:uncharacterized protein A1O9_01460 [Exophiala aquamarina CBS 119918]KEF63482.1 hypothetical protein A1O9_01460 [Exophiala aquamarina CBS 119918]
MPHIVLLGISFVLATTTVALTLLLVVAGTRPDIAPGYYIIALNTSTIGQSLIQVEPAASDSGDPLGILDDLLGGALSEITESIGDGIGDVEAEIVSRVTDFFGVSDFYKVFLRNICQGNYSDPAEPNTSVVNESCPSFRDSANSVSHLTSSIPSHFVIGTANVSIPLLGQISNSFDYVQSLADSIGTALFAFLLISLISSCVVMIGSILCCVSRVRNIFVRINLCFSALGAHFLLLAAITVTVVVEAVGSFTKQFTSTINIYVEDGDKFIAVAWIAAACTFPLLFLWFAVWFVEVRTWALSKRKREAQEIGNWKGIFREIWGDLKGIKRQKNQ